MSYHFARISEDGRLTSPILHTGFATIAEAKAAAPELLGRIHKNSAKIVLVQVLEDASVTATITYRKWMWPQRKS
jgi:hypothetical protein